MTEGERAAASLYRRALERMGEAERARERDHGAIPYDLSLRALAGPFLEVGMRQGWLPCGGRVLAAVSGGGDSMALLWLFKTFYDGPLTVAHVNHGIRGGEADADAAFVRNVAEGWGVPFMERALDVPGERARGESIEAAARRLRYRALREMAEACGAVGVALGHNRDDLAETVLFNLLRGAGVRGAVGMPERRGLLFRPVIGMSRDLLRRVLRVRGIAWREDGTNADAGCTRNFLRLELMPLLARRVNAGAAEHLAAFGAEMRELRGEEEARGAKLLAGLVLEEEAGLLALDRAGTAALTPRERTLVLRAAGRRLGLAALPRGRSLELARLMGRPGPFVFQWGGGASVLGERGRLRWTAPTERPQ